MGIGDKNHMHASHRETEAQRKRLFRVILVPKKLFPGILDSQE
jgi:hypothetical protein